MKEMNSLIKPHRGQIFRNLRHKKGLSLQALGVAVGVDPSTISRWEARKEFVQFGRFVQSLHALGTTPEEFLGLQPPSRPRPDRGIADPDAAVEATDVARAEHR